MRLLVDMDEIITDFVGAACKAWGTEAENLYPHWTPGVWDMIPPLNKALKIPGPAMTDEEFWSRLNSSWFWESMEPLPWAREVIDLVSSTTDDWHIVTTPSHCPTSYTGKVRWLKKFFGPRFDRFAITPHKYIFAGPGVCLIDDRESNLRDFTAHGGGSTILFPRYHNSLHAMREDPIAVLREQLELLKGAKPCI